MRVAVLASTNGTDMDALFDGESFKLSLVIVNKECGAKEKAESHGIETVLIPSKGRDREAYDKEVMANLEEHRIDLVVCIGYMRIISEPFVDRWRNRIMNIHPSLLPAFAGGMDKSVHDAVLERGCKLTGCTLHFVDEGADTGPIILQEAVKVDDDETAESLKDKVQEAEKDLIRKGVELFSEGRITVEGHRVRIS